MAGYLRPRTLAEALAALAAGPAIPLAGATDLYPAAAGARAFARTGLDHPAAAPLLDLSGLAELRGLRIADGMLEIGALVTWSEVLTAELPSGLTVLREAAREVGGRQIQNRGTVVGNLCNASPAADGVPPLLVLDATVVLRAQGGVRELPLDAFILGSRRTARRPDELVTAIRCPLPPADARSRFLKLGARAYLVISIAMVAGLAACDRAGRIIDLRLAVGACAPVAVRLRQLERRLVGQPLAAAAGRVGADDLAGLAPIDDVRASAAYRRDAALVLVRRVLAGLAAEQPVTVAA